MEFNLVKSLELNAQRKLQEAVGAAMKKATENYIPDEWTTCPDSCEECERENKLWPHPHQTRLEDGMASIDYIRQYLPKSQ